MSKPVYVFIPGAWHGPEAFNETATILKKSGYESEYVTLPSVGASTPVTGFEPDVEAAKTVIQKVLDSGKNVVIVMHSYGGAVGQQVVGELDQSKAKVVRLAYICAFIFQKGQSLMGMLGMNPLPWFVIKNDEKEVDCEDPKTIFYNDLSEDAAKPWISKLATQGYRVMFSEVTVEAWKDIPTAYLVCTADNAIPVPIQEGMIAGAQGVNSKAFDIIEKVESSHSPFLSMPEKTASFLEKVAL